VELVTSIATIAVVFLYPSSLTTLAMLILLCWLITLAVIDYKSFYLPDMLTQPLLWLGLLFSLWGILAVDLPSALLGACVGYLSLWLLDTIMRLITKKEGMGGGDFKLFAALGAWFGWQILPNMALIAAIAGIIVTLIRYGFTQNTDVLKKPLAFGPYLAFSGVFMLIIHSPLFII
jgi:prepilin signal peptidase PulO-like enzyme (type II secretory pathway)